MGKKLDESKLKANLKLTVQRLKLQKKKRANLADQTRRTIADELAKGAEADARVHAESVLQEDRICEAYEVLELHCELLLSRISVLKLSKAVPGELTEAVATLWCVGCTTVHFCCHCALLKLDCFFFRSVSQLAAFY